MPDNEQDEQHEKDEARQALIIRSLVAANERIDTLEILRQTETQLLASKITNKALEDMLASQREKTAELLKELQAEVKANAGKTDNTGEILELLDLADKLNDKVKQTEKEKSKISEEYLYQKKRREQETQQHKAETKKLREWGNHLNDQLKKTKLTKEQYADDEGRIKKAGRKKP